MDPFISSEKRRIPTVPLTQEAFAPFGTVIASPLPLSKTTIPSPPPKAIFANQGTALKYPNVSPLRSTYHLSPSGVPAYSTMSMFSCFPRKLRETRDGQIFDIRILERHPYTTQTFTPLSSAQPQNARAIIIVAPTLPAVPGPSALTPYFPQFKEGGPPDLQNLKAFVAEPGIGVTYEVGTWHAPMVVIGKSRMDFVVTQFMSGREGEDCQEVEIEGFVEVIIGLEKQKLWEKSKI